MDSRIRALSRYRFEQAKQCIESAKLLTNAGDYKGAANRSYYAIFHAMRSVLALDNIDFSKHSGVSAYFRKTYVISKEEVEEQITNAEKFCEAVLGYLRVKGE